MTANAPDEVRARGAWMPLSAVVRVGELSDVVRFTGSSDLGVVEALVTGGVLRAGWGSRPPRIGCDQANLSVKASSDSSYVWVRCAVVRPDR